MSVVDGAALLRECEAEPGRPFVLSHEQMEAIARSLMAAQAMAAGQARMDTAIGAIAGITA